MHALGYELRLGCRRLRQSPVFTVFSIASLALGIGATTAIYSFVRAVMSPPSGVRDVGGVMNIYHFPGGSLPVLGLSWGDYQDFKARQTVFDEVTAWTFFRQAYTANGYAETSFGELVDGNYFRLLRVRPVVGRALQPADDQIGGAPVAVISYQVWQRVFGGGPDVIGQRIRLNGHAFEIVGVAPADFHGLFNNGFVPTAMWVPLTTMPLLPSEGHSLDSSNRDNRWLLVKGRLRDDRTVGEAQAEATGIAHALDAVYPIGRQGGTWPRMPYATSRQWRVRPAADVIVNEGVDSIIRPLMFALMVAVCLVLLVACTNLANLMLARSSGRRHETAVRIALGASRSRLIREALAESLLVAVAGGAIGLAIVPILIRGIAGAISVGNGTVLLMQPIVDGAVLAGSLVATMLALLVAGVGPALQSTRADVRTALATDGPNATAPRWRGRRVLIAVQVSISLVLLAVATVAARQVQQERRTETGLDLEHLALVQVDFRLQQYDPDRAHQIIDAVLDQIARQPNVEAVAASSGLPIGVDTPGASIIAGVAPAYVELMASTPGIFQTLGVSIVRGRGLNAHDIRGASPALVLSERAARDLFGTSDVIGRQVILTPTRWVGMPKPRPEPGTIVGIAADTDTRSPGRRDHGTAYLSLNQHDEGRLVLSARASGDPAPLIESLRRALQVVDPEVAISQSGTGLQVANPSNLFLEVVAALATLLGSFALVLALAGLYGALSHIVSGRTHEIGIRMALGAPRRQIISIVLADGLRPVVYGLAAGAVFAVLIRMALQPFFLRLVPRIDPFILLTAPVSMLIAALIACYVPARRAARVDPVTALRAE